MMGCSTEEVRIPCLWLRTDSSHEVIALSRDPAAGERWHNAILETG